MCKALQMKRPVTLWTWPEILHEKEWDSKSWNMLMWYSVQFLDCKIYLKLKTSVSNTPSALINLNILVNRAAKKAVTATFKWMHQNIFRLCCHQIIMLWLKQNRRQWKSTITPKGKMFAQKVKTAVLEYPSVHRYLWILQIKIFIMFFC